MFLLDMGEPDRIKDLAEQMVRLSGFSLRDAHHPSGDIEIICNGLRPGEKLYEELLIDAESEPTKHPLIYRAREQALPPSVLWPRIDALEAAINRQDVPSALAILIELVPEWKRAAAKLATKPVLGPPPNLEGFGAPEATHPQPRQTPETFLLDMLCVYANK